MNKHTMGLYAEPFESIRSGKKTVEVRLNDEKRRAIQLGDVIEFVQLPEETERLQVQVVNLRVFPSFRKTYETIPAEKFDATGRTIDQMVARTYRFYTPEQERALGTVAIRVMVLDSQQPQMIEQTRPNAGAHIQ